VAEEWSKKTTLVQVNLKLHQASFIVFNAFITALKISTL
jgi:hypothetical protein